MYTLYYAHIATLHFSGSWDVSSQRSDDLVWMLIFAKFFLAEYCHAATIWLVYQKVIQISDMTSKRIVSGVPEW